MTQENELIGLAKAKDDADKNLTRSFEKVRFLAKALYGLGTAIVFITVWITTVQIKLSQHDKEIALNSEARETNRLIQQTLKSAIDVTAEATRRNEASIKALQQKVYGFVP